MESDDILLIESILSYHGFF